MESNGVSVGKPSETVAISACPSPQKIRKKKRCGTHSISPSPKQLRASIPVVEPSPLPVSKVASEANSNWPTVASMEVQPPISPPGSTGRLSNRKRRATFSISTPSSGRGPTTPNVDINLASSELQPPAPKRSRQLTLEKSPEADDMKNDSGQKPRWDPAHYVMPTMFMRPSIVTEHIRIFSLISKNPYKCYMLHSSVRNVVFCWDPMHLCARGSGCIQILQLTSEFDTVQSDRIY